jgi:hypothetical protein
MPVREFSPGERERVEKYLLLDEEHLYSLIPPYLLEFDGTVFQTEGQVEAGRRWFAALRPRLEQKLCDEWQMCKKIDDPDFEDAAKVVVILGDALATVVAGVPPVLVSSIIVRIGLRRFCDCT